MRVSGFASLPSSYSMTGSWTAQASRAVLVACAGIMGAFGVGRRQDEYAEDLEED